MQATQKAKTRRGDDPTMTSIEEQCNSIVKKIYIYIYIFYSVLTLSIPLSLSHTHSLLHILMFLADQIFFCLLYMLHMKSNTKLLFFFFCIFLVIIQKIKNECQKLCLFIIVEYKT